MEQNYQLSGRIWIEGPDGTYLGAGRVTLLENIRDHGSISAAARAMKMSYKRAWNLVDSMNRQSQTPVVELTTGGKGGGGAVLTASGIKAIACFRAAHRDFQAFMADRSEQLNL
ncbi:LysR family transcriptional regulator [Oceanospirillum sp. D5]|uniref:LysR family transcriptional regulator n=2 Tax=Oceanospirillum sediminis TaxID=2760088 RepID=A0A839ISV0_9GAMM|nr:LysR family transcriptional regulator [Oceanospirillum sediminis]